MPHLYFAETGEAPECPRSSRPWDAADEFCMSTQQCSPLQPHLLPVASISRSGQSQGSKSIRLRQKALTGNGCSHNDHRHGCCTAILCCLQHSTCWNPPRVGQPLENGVPYALQLRLQFDLPVCGQLRETGPRPPLQRRTPQPYRSPQGLNSL